MPVRFARLRIAGFKSFAEPAQLEIQPGLTGIVGPNGCGKSNVVEALRWVMGESSARSLRGDEMDDVIFAGTAHRPSRNLAEVTLALEDTAGVAPPPLHEAPELEVSRRIERGGGSAYRVNGREARARDVQTLFADLASGARASAMVSQGRVGALVNARPDDRRAILEEAAGITGLHARRHEAELKLRAAEANLARAEDLRGQLESQLQGLKRQARQAHRYRNVGAAIRAAEAELLGLQQARAAAARAQAHAAEAQARALVAAREDAVRAAAALAQGSGETLPARRAAEAEARTALERRRLAEERIAEEETRARAALAAARARREQIERDLAHAREIAADAEAATARLAREAVTLAEEDAAHPARLAAAEAEAEAAASALRAAEAAAERGTETVARLDAETQSLTRELAEAEARHRRQSEHLARAEAERGRVQIIPPERLAAADVEQKAAEAALGAARTALAAAEQARQTAQAALATARATASAAGARRAKLAAEAAALTELLGAKDHERWPRMVDALSVPPGLELALGAALGEELESAADPAAARHWRALPPLEPAPLPEGARPLAETVQAPPALDRALARIGLVTDAAAAEAAQPALAPGQMLVSAEGAVWRWDGYCIRAGAPRPAAVRLRQRNRLAALRQELADAERAAVAAAGALATAEAEDRAAGEAEQRARAARREAEPRLERARQAAAGLAAQEATAAARLAALDEQISRAAAEHADAEAALTRARAARGALPDLAAARAELAAARSALATARSREAAARAAREARLREQAGRERRTASLGAEREGWAERAKDAAYRLTDLLARQGEAGAEERTLAAAPDVLATRRGAARAALAGAETAHRDAAAALAAAEREAEQARAAAHDAEAALGAAREDAVRAEGLRAQADQAWGVVAERVLERLGPDAELPQPAAATAEAEEQVRRRLERLLREREGIGPVNLRAEIEAGEIETRIDAIARDRDELATAIAKLRGSIGHLNREGRERLGAVFAEVDRHFQALFTRMFGGGRAHLAFVGSDDPLAAGLEIYAEPPGKKLATLSLLSGGEQALTALSLIFAVFRCNPAPVCVLDEVDAPLDDANVERFATLLADMAGDTGTRFLVVTHNHLTMARMDRLYGVTMQERGVSRLLSVDLGTARDYAEAPRIAAE